MNRIYSNRKKGEFVYGAFSQMLQNSIRACLAAPYFTESELLFNAAESGKNIKLLIGLNEITCPRALRKICGVSGIEIRYFTSGFHAKIFIFDQSALLGSANLTKGGLFKNLEAVIELNDKSDSQTMEKIRALFEELWKTGKVLTTEKLDEFERVRDESVQNIPRNKAKIENIIGKAQPFKLNSANLNKSRNLLEPLRNAFVEVKEVLDEQKINHPELMNLEIEYVTNRFLNYVMLTHQSELLQSSVDRQKVITDYANNWIAAADSKVPEDYVQKLQNVKQTFVSEEQIMVSDKNQIMSGLMSIHACYNYSNRKGGQNKYQEYFWTENENNLPRVRSTLTYLLYGDGDFFQRFHEVTKNQSRKLIGFGPSCAIELYGTVNPGDFPPMNSRIATGLRLLGFDVRVKF